jgi:CDP-2,3-bis-(O-geranylgeranyl)-sn-glycerol synthase
MDVYTLFFAAVHFAWPCWLVNLSFQFLVPIRRRFPQLERINFPMDGGIVLRDGMRLFGTAQGTLSLFFVILIPLTLYLFGVDSFGVLLLKAVCVMLGDLVGSFVKRRLKMARGTYLVGVDHGDYMIMSSIVFLSLGMVSVPVACFALIITYIFHPLFCLAGYGLGIKDRPL